MPESKRGEYPPRYNITEGPETETAKLGSKNRSYEEIIRTVIIIIVSITLTLAIITFDRNLTGFIVNDSLINNNSMTIMLVILSSILITTILFIISRVLKNK